MCLLIVLHRAHPDAALIVAANRDEVLARPAVAMAILRASSPRVLGGRDELGGGTWLAVNELGVFAGLTNRPAPARELSRRSRGELPIALARHPDADAAVAAFRRDVRPRDYNPAWLLVGDRRALYYVDVTGGERPGVTALPAGLHVLENGALGAPSAKADHVRGRLAGVFTARGEELRSLLVSVLSDHEVPPAARDALTAPGEPQRPLQAYASCVHLEGYGTRWSAVLSVPAEPGPPRLDYADGPPCTAPFTNAAALWRDGRGR